MTLKMGYWSSAAEAVKDGIKRIHTEDWSSYFVDDGHRFGEWSFIVINHIPRHQNRVAVTSEGASLLSPKMRDLFHLHAIIEFHLTQHLGATCKINGVH